MQVASRQTAEKYGVISGANIGESVVHRKNEDPGKIHELAIHRVGHSEGKVKRIIGTLALAAGLTVLLAGVPSMAADVPTEPPAEEASTVNSPGVIVIPEYLDVPRIARQEKPKPKRRNPGRENPIGLESPCINNGFVAKVLRAVVHLELACIDDEPVFP